MEGHVTEIAELLNVEKREIYITLSRLNYIVNSNQKWEYSEKGEGIFSFSRVPELILEIEQAIEDDKEPIILQTIAARKLEYKKIECEWCKQLKHPMDFGKSSDVCTPCLRGWFARRS